MVISTGTWEGDRHIPPSLLGKECFLIATPQVKSGRLAGAKWQLDAVAQLAWGPAEAPWGAPETQTTGKCKRTGPEASTFPQGSTFP